MRIKNQEDIKEDIEAVGLNFTHDWFDEGMQTSFVTTLTGLSSVSFIMFLHITSSGISSLQLIIVLTSRVFQCTCLKEENWGDSLEKEKSQ